MAGKVHGTDEGTNAGTPANLFEANRIAATPHHDATVGKVGPNAFEQRVQQN